MVYIGINELVLALGLDHVVALLTQSADNAEDGKFAYLSERVLLYHHEQKRMSYV